MDPEAMKSHHGEALESDNEPNVYEAACEAYSAFMTLKGWNGDDLPDAHDGYHADHSEAIGEAVDAAVKAERERVVEAFDACLVCRAITNPEDVLDALQGIVADFRGAK